MPIRKAETYTLGAVDSRSNPANFPPERSLRCHNWTPQESGSLRLRSGYTMAMGATNDSVGPVPLHSLIYYEIFSANAIGPQYCLYGKGNQVLTFDMTAEISTVIGGMPNSNPWGHFRSKNYIHLGDGSVSSQFGYDFGMQNWDGTKFRPTGIPTSSTSGTVAISSSSVGSWAPTMLTGYQLYGAWYNPITQHMGNRQPLGARFTVSATLSHVLLTALAVPPNPEWVTALGLTNDGGQIPYWLIDNSGNHIIVGNGPTTATIETNAVDPLSELAVRNYVPIAFDKFARVGTRIFANKQGSPYIYYSNDEADVLNADYVGDPVSSWPPDQAEPLPTGELPTALHAYQKEGWFFSRNNLAIFSTLLANQGADPWRGPYQGGCAGQRAFVETPYGPYWVTGNKQLATFMEDGVVPVSEEYEAALLSKLADATLSQTEVCYLIDPDQRTDIVMIRGLDKDGNTIVVVHDFCLKDARSPFGCAYTYAYQGLDPQTFAGAGYTPRQNVYDTNGKMRIWSGAKQGFIAQVEDGSNNDNGVEYDADYIDMIAFGENRPSLAELGFQGDMNLQVSYTRDYSLDPSGFQAAPLELIPGEKSVYGAKMDGGEVRWAYMRLQLTSHSADGNFDITDPPFCPMPTYGCINMVSLKIGRDRPEAR